MEDRKRNGKLICVMIVAVLYAAALIVVSAMKTSIVIANGIIFYRTVRQAVLMIGALVVVLALAAFVKDVFRSRKQRREFEKAQAQSKAAEEEKINQAKKEKETLSVSRNMDSVKIREILDTYSAGDWRALAGEMRQIHIQLDMMDEQQEKLAHLLRSNGADALSNTVEILDKVEQHMCRSVRKVINYMDVASPQREEDVKKVLEKLYACHADNQTQLQQVQEFLFALADFLNTQGDDDNSVQMLELYKTTILDSIKD